MKKRFKLFGIIVLVSVIGFSMIACSNGTTGGPGTTSPDPQDVKYVSYGSDGNKYELIITDKAKAAKAIRAAYNPKNGDKFELIITNIMGDIIGKSTGSVTIDSTDGSSITFTLTSKDETVFSVTVTSNSSSSGSDGKIDVIKVDNGIPNELEGGQPISVPDKLTEAPVAPEELTDKKRWIPSVAGDSTATLVYSIDADDVCTITIDGVTMSGTAGWKARMVYPYTAKANTPYEYKFEAWTESGTRDLTIQYYWDEDEKYGLYDWSNVLTTERKTYTVKGQIPKGGVYWLEFHGALQLGTFYVKMLSITEYTPALEYELNYNGTGYTLVSALGMSGSVVIPETYEGKPVTSIGWNAFRNLKNLTSITIPASVTSIGGGTFKGSTNLTRITVDAGNPYYSSEGGILYNKEKNEIIAYPSASGSITIPAGVWSIGNAAFEGCTGLTGVIIHESVYSISNYAFGECTNIKTITTPVSAYVGYRAFNGWTASQTVNIPFESKEAADNEWGSDWRLGCNAIIKWSGSNFTGGGGGGGGASSPPPPISGQGGNG